jgi:hypothetical protein
MIHLKLKENKNKLNPKLAKEENNKRPKNKYSMK